LQLTNCLLCGILGSGQIEFEEFTILAAKFIIEEDDEDVQKELKEAFRLYDKDGKSIN
jgi:calmodulin